MENLVGAVYSGLLWGECMRRIHDPTHIKLGCVIEDEFSCLPHHYLDAPFMRSTLLTGILKDVWHKLDAEINPIER